MFTTLSQTNLVVAGYERGTVLGSVHNIELVENFYAAFDRRDAQAMVDCYATDITFSDPAFGELHGSEVVAMWTMLCQSAPDLEVEASDIRADSDTGSAHWVAQYSFGPMRRKVTNHVEANFVFRDGLIAEHRDSFSFYRWSKQAFGPLGLVLGWTPLSPVAMRSLSRRQLNSYMAKKGF